MLDKVTNLTAVDVYTIPWIVNGAFACELGLKYILTQNAIGNITQDFIKKYVQDSYILHFAC